MKLLQKVEFNAEYERTIAKQIVDTGKVIEGW